MRIENNQSEVPCIRLKRREVLPGLAVLMRL